MESETFKFNISLSVLNHLGRNLYRNFSTVLGEAISNSWDANATNVWIYLDKENSTLCVKDDGDGMSKEDFQEKFLKIGYSKRRDGVHMSPNGRPYIGRKGIGKLALLSCAKNISILSKQENSEYVGGMIDNEGLDQAIVNDLSSHDYNLEVLDGDQFTPYLNDFAHGTIIYFEGVNDGIRNSEEFLRKVVALHFRFSLIEPNFNIFLNDELITLESLRDLAVKTQFVWNINNFADPYLADLCKPKETIATEMSQGILGFIASVEKPKDRNIHTTGEKVGIDLFVNGRLRESDILKHVQSARVPESYLYGQIHVNALDGDNVDRFTSSREGLISDDAEYANFLAEFKKVVTKIIEDWDSFREKYKNDGDPDNTRKTKKQRRAEELANAVFEEFTPPEGNEQRGKVEDWGDELRSDASFNFQAYADCFASENLLRKYIQSEELDIASKNDVVTFWRGREVVGMRAGNVTINLRRTNEDIFYLGMDDLVEIIVPGAERGNPNVLSVDAKQFAVIRNAMMHTALLSEEAKRRLTTVYDNIRGKIRELLAE